MRKEGFNPKQLREHFAAGSTVTLGAAEAMMEAAIGSVRITFTPPDASVAVARAGELPIKITSGNTLSLQPGTYALTAITGEHTQNSVFQVVAGQLKTLDLSLTGGGMENWEVPGGWRSEGQIFIRKGGGLVLYKTTPTRGTFIFSALLRKGHRLQWVLNCTDDKNYLLFQMDDDNLFRSVVHDGEAIEAAEIPYNSDKKKFRTFQIRISPDEITTQIQRGQQWEALDRIAMPGVDASAGMFGFLISGSDEVALSNFHHYAERGPK